MANIYKITNKCNGKSYIGKTLKSIESRFNDHVRESVKDRSKHRPLYRAFRKYGVENFEISLLEVVDDKLSSEVEKNWIEIFQTYSSGYNATLGGDGTSYVNKDKIVELYLQGNSVKVVALLVGCHVETVRDSLREKHIKIKPSYPGNYRAKKVRTEIDGVEFVFDSTRSAARFLISTGKSNTKESGLSSHISEVCRGKRKTVCGLVWNYF